MKKLQNPPKTLIIIVIILGVGLLLKFVILPCVFDKKDEKVTIEKAEKSKDDRYLTIINATDQVINEIYVTIGEGTEIEKRKNPNENTVLIKISDAYDEYDTFTVALIDRYGFKYEKSVSDVKKTGRTEVKITEDDHVKQKGDWKRKIDKFFNGD